MDIDIRDYYSLTKVLSVDFSGGYALVATRGPDKTGRKPLYSVWKIRNPILKARIANLDEKIEDWNEDIRQPVLNAHLKGIEFYHGQEGKLSQHRPKNWNEFTGPTGFDSKYRQFLNQHPDVEHHRTKKLVGRPSGTRTAPISSKTDTLDDTPSKDDTKVLITKQDDYEILDWLNTGKRTIDDAQSMYPEYVRKVNTNVHEPAWGTQWHREENGFLVPWLSNYSSSGN